MLLALLAAVCAATAFGIAAVLQGVATRREPGTDGVDPALLLRLVRHPVFLASLALNLIGFSLHAVALQSLPLFYVQAVISSSVAVTALLSVRVFAVPLSSRQLLAVGTVLVGLALLGPSAEPVDRTDPGSAATWILLLVLLLVGTLSVAAGRLVPSAASVALGLLAGVSFGVVALSLRLLPDLEPATLVSSPVTYVLLLAGLLAFHLYSDGMQRGSVTTTTAALVITQTGAPALVGALLLGDTVRPGYAPVAVAGFLLALTGALGLARFEAGAPVPGPAASAAGRGAG